MPDYPNMIGQGSKVQRWKEKIRKDPKVMRRIREIAKLSAEIEKITEERENLAQQIDDQIDLQDGGRIFRAGGLFWNGQRWYELLNDPYNSQRWAVDFLARFVVMVQQKEAEK